MPTARQGRVREKVYDAIASQLPPDNHPPGLVNPVNLESVLGKIKPDGDNGHVDGPPECGGF